VDGNARRIIEAASVARDRERADVVVFPELALSGYPPEDLLFHTGMRRRVAEGLARAREEISGIAALIGYPEYVQGKIYNSAALVRDGQLLANHRKQCLPNYKVFDEKRYFVPGTEPTVIELAGRRIGLLVCEDAWDPEPARAAVDAGAELILIPNASPYELRKQIERETIIRDRVREVGRPFVYTYLVGGQDELVFDGPSFVMDASGEIVARAPAFTESIFSVELRSNDQRLTPVRCDIAPYHVNE